MPGTTGGAEPQRPDARVPLGMIGMALVACWAVREVRRRRAAEDSRARVVGDLFDAAEEERRRLARELHDDVCQELAMLSIDAFHARKTFLGDREDQVASALTSLEQRAAAAAETIRRLSHDLHPATLNHVGLVDGIRAHCADTERRYRARVLVHLGGDLPQFGGGTAAVSLFRVFQEAMRNALAHGAARTIVVSLAVDRSDIRLAVVDDGIGFDAKTCAPGLGLISMSERASLLGGTTLITSHPGEGTAVRVTVPRSALAEHGPDGHQSPDRTTHVVPRGARTWFHADA